MSEAHGIPQDQHDAARKLNPAAILMTGNALGGIGGEFYESHHERADLWDTLKIDDEDIKDDPRPGMLTAQDVADRAKEWGEDSPLFVSSVKAQWPDNADDTLVSLTDANAARDAKQSLTADSDTSRGRSALRQRPLVSSTSAQGAVARPVLRHRARPLCASSLTR